MAASSFPEEFLVGSEKSEYEWILPNSMKSTDTLFCSNRLNQISPIFPENSQWQWKINFCEINKNYFHSRIYNVIRLIPLKVLPKDISVKYELKVLNAKNEMLDNFTAELKFEDDEIKLEKFETTVDRKNIFKIHAIVFYHTARDCHKSVIKKYTPLKELSDNFGRLLTNGEFSDFLIKCDNDYEFPVHKGILAIRSPVFAAMFRHDTSESRLGYVTVTDVDGKSMGHLLYFIYTGEVKNMSYEETKNLIYAANKYQVDDLKNRCGEIIIGYMNLSNALDILKLSEVYNLPDVKSKAFDYILENSQEFNEKMLVELKNYPDLLMQLFVKQSKMLKK